METKELISQWKLGNTIEYTVFLKEVCRLACARYDRFSYIDMNKVMIALAKNRSNAKQSYRLGACYPGRFPGGETTVIKNGVKFFIPEIYKENIEILYFIKFYSPHFIDLAVEEKIRVIFHELFHISPEFNGDIRRFGSKAHGSCKKKFDTHFYEEQKDFANYLQDFPEMYNVLTMNYKSIFLNYYEIQYTKVKIPKPIRY